MSEQQTWQTMDAGEDLDVLIAERVGLNVYHKEVGGWPAFSVQREWLDVWIENEHGLAYEIPAYSTDANAAFSLLSGEAERVGLEYNLYGVSGGHTCEVGFWTNEAGRRDRTWEGTGQTPALAIVHAYLAWREGGW